MSIDPEDENKTGERTRSYDLIIYGATGFTGNVVAIEFCKRYATSNINFKWAIAGRNTQKLNSLKQRLQRVYNQEIANLSRFSSLSNTPEFTSNPNTLNLKEFKLNYIQELPMIAADVQDVDGSLREMVNSTHLVMSCVGPYRSVGENVVRVCAESGTHYVDICGEPEFMENCAFKYFETAKQNGCFIVSACGFDSVPSDMGTQFIDQWYLNNGGICSTINGYLTGTAPKGYSVHKTTLEAAIHGISNVQNLRKLRRKVSQLRNEQVYKTERKQIFRASHKQKVHKESYFWSKESKKWSMLFPMADSAVVSNSQGITSSLLSMQGITHKTYPQYAAYISFNSGWQLSTAIGVGLLGQTLAGYGWGQKLLLDYPDLMSWGVFSEDGPTEEQRREQTFEFIFFANGYSQALCEHYHYNIEQLKEQPTDLRIKAIVSGHDIAYTGTAQIMVECAICMLQELNRIKDGDLKRCFPAMTGGVFTPSTVFANTSLIERLNEAGITFAVDDDNYTDSDDEEDAVHNLPIMISDMNMAEDDMKQFVRIETYPSNMNDIEINNGYNNHNNHNNNSNRNRNTNNNNNNNHRNQNGYGIADDYDIVELPLQSEPHPTFEENEHEHEHEHEHDIESGRPFQQSLLYGHGNNNNNNSNVNDNDNDVSHKVSIFENVADLNMSIDSQISVNDNHYDNEDDNNNSVHDHYIAQDQNQNNNENDNDNNMSNTIDVNTVSIDLNESNPAVNDNYVNNREENELKNDDVRDIVSNAVENNVNTVDVHSAPQNYNSRMSSQKYENNEYQRFDSSSEEVPQ